MGQKAVKQPALRHAYSPHNAADYAIHSDQESMTKQSFKESCDINNIMAKYQKTGVIDHISIYEAHYGEMSGQDFKEQLDQVTFAMTMFNDLPSAAREYFEQDPAKFLDFMDNCDRDDADNVQKLKDLQLLDPQSTLWMESRQVDNDEGIFPSKTETPTEDPTEEG